MVQNLMCVGNSDETSLAITWDRPVAQGSEVFEYRIEASRLQQLASRELVTVPLSPVYDELSRLTEAQVTQGLGMSLVSEA